MLIVMAPIWQRLNVLKCLKQKRGGEIDIRERNVKGKDKRKKCRENNDKC
jgi:hypothetical protein